MEKQDCTDVNSINSYAKYGEWTENFFKESKKTEEEERRRWKIVVERRKNLYGFLCKMFRENGKFSQQEMADKLGWSLLVLKRFENGTAALSINRTDDFERVTGVKFDTVFELVELSMVKDELEKSK